MQFLFALLIFCTIGLSPLYAAPSYTLEHSVVWTDTEAYTYTPTTQAKTKIFILKSLEVHRITHMKVRNWILTDSCLIRILKA